MFENIANAMKFSHFVLAITFSQNSINPALMQIQSSHHSREHKWFVRDT